VRAAEACRDIALAFNMPFISGKDSLKNEYHSGDCHIVIPPTLLISALGQVPDVRRCVTMDLKEAGNRLYLLGTTKDEMGGSHYQLVTGQVAGVVPKVDPAQAPRIYHKLHAAMRRGMVRSCHDLSEGGLATAVAEMAFAGEIGADITGLSTAPDLADEVLLFSESQSRFVVEVRRADAPEFEAFLGEDVPWQAIGETTKEQRLRIAGTSGEWVVWADLAALKEAWQKPLRW
jgi:phosphoribosylformylglycinamidine synthase